MQTVLLAAGAGRRLRPLTATTPKPLLPVGGTPLLTRIAGATVDAGATELYVVVPPDHGRFVSALGSAVDDVPVEYVVQPRPTGTAEALRRVASLVDGPFAVIPGDCLYDSAALGRLFEMAPSVGVDADRAPPRVVGDGGHSETTAVPDGDVPFAGACTLPAAARNWFGVDVGDSGERELDAVVERTAAEFDLTSVEDVVRVDVDRPVDLLRATDAVMAAWADGVDDPVVEGSVSDAAAVTGPVHVAEGARVRHGAVVEGPAVVASGATLGPNAYVRPGSHLAPDVEVGHAAQIAHSVLLTGATVGHQCSVREGILGEDVSFGPATTVARRTDGPGRAGASDDELVGVVAGPGATTGVDTTVGYGATLGARTRTDPDEYVGPE